jgi:IS30 family transposase
MYFSISQIKGVLTPAEHRHSMRTYHQLTQEQRYQIYSFLKMGHQQIEIVGCIGVHKSTISRELRRNRGDRGCRPQQAHRNAISREKIAF